MLNLTSCTYDKTVVTLGSGFDSTWDFSSNSGYDYDPNYVEIRNGKAQLKALDLEHSGADFNNGTHVGSLSQSAVKLRTSADPANDFRNILPNKILNIAGYWRFDENCNDVSQFFNHCSVNGTPTISSGRIGNSYLFQSTTDYLEVAHSPSLNLINSITISTWLRTNGTNDYSTILNKKNTDLTISGYGLSVWTDSTVRCDMIFNHSTSQRGSVFSSSSIEDSLWHHVVCTYDGSEVKIYIDGQLENSEPYLTGIASNTEGLFIGRDDSIVSRNFDGNIDEVLLLDTPLSIQEVSLLYNQQSELYSDQTELNPLWTPKFDNIVGYWKMDGNWQDSSGNGNHGTPLVGATIANDGQVGQQTGYFNDFGDGLGLGSIASYDSALFSVIAWIRLDDIASNRAVGNVFWSNYLDGNNRLYFFQSNANDKLSFYGVNAGSPVVSVTSNRALAANRWYHIAVTCSVSLGEAQIYIDGIADGSTGSCADISINNHFLGIQDGVSQSLIGNIDDLAIFSNSLSSIDVQLMYNRQKQKYAGHYDSEVIGLGSITSEWPDLSWLTSLPFGKEFVGDFDNDGNPDSESSSDYYLVEGSLSNGLVAYWNFNEEIADSLPGGFDVEDQSGQGNHGNDTGNVTFNATGVFSRSIGFDGSSQFITVPDDASLDITGDLSLSLWLQTTSNDATDIILTKKNGSYELYLQSGFVRYCVSLSSCPITSTIKVNDGKFHHIALSLSGNIYKIYVDGMDVSNQTGTDTLSVNANTLQIAARSVSDHLESNIDEIAIWSRALTDSEVQQLYRRGANRIKFQVKSCVDSSCSCKSYGAGGTENDCDGDTIVNNLDNDDIHKAEFIGPGGDGTTYYSELYNRNTTDITFNCALNTTDSNPGVCVGDEITLAGSPKPTGPEFLNIDYTQFVNPSPNQYAQYRVYMEADENTACGGEPCLPELTSVSLNPTGAPRYAGGFIEVKPKNPITFNQIRNIQIEADSCVTFRLARSGTSYYYDTGTGSWVLATLDTHRSTQSEVESNILKFASQFGPGRLEVIAYLETDGAGTTQCQLDEIDVNYK